MDIRPLDGSELVEAATLLSRGMCDNPINVAVFGGDGLQRQRMLVAFYRKYGFEVTGHGDVLKVPNWFMTRSKQR
jgi:hypothetical protein